MTPQDMKSNSFTCPNLYLSSVPQSQSHKSGVLLLHDTCLRQMHYITNNFSFLTSHYFYVVAKTQYYNIIKDMLELIRSQ